ncbi:UvrD-helicase domain-containing protein [Streptomyces sp. NBC_00503]|uniref:UvrD-helicase domain-containing protein n=1 Tax=Streptomyces sp. NBC_00503 TaxID=2903659 RepID=UPI002E818546|nr:UvrD-helicase domain-containing protein [Streptomyces sp. NBC_00503]WUD84451.1 UvrD-helicase domain-containing protein [Streptomyces sp. NBC_00503]
MTTPYRPDALAKDKVEALAQMLGLDLPHTEQWEFVQSEISQDLQAAPGSGKTTLIGLKLALLASAWTSPTRGICVLSHTNAAKNEITDRLMAVRAGRRFLQYPHFIGTIQSFTNTYLALPAVRALGHEVQVVDDDTYEAAALRLLERPEFTTLRNFLDRRHKGFEMATKAVFVCEAGRLTISGPGGSFPADLETTASGRQYVGLKKRLSQEGVFRYDDMYAIAEWYLARNPTIAAAVSKRFPFVLLDEMQDTDDVQQHLLDLVFASGAVVQRVGDVNQGIFIDGTAGSPRASAFPAPLAAELPVSRRFGPRIADLASDLTFIRRQRINGAGPDTQIGLLLFDDRSVLDVVPRFEQMANELVPREVLVRNPPRVLGARLLKGVSGAYPQSLTCYVPDHVPAGLALARSALINTVRIAGARWAAGDGGHEAVAELWEGVRTALRPAFPAVLPPLRRLERTADTAGGQIRLALRDLLMGACDGDESTWNAATTRLLELVSELTQSPFRNAVASSEGLRFTPRLDIEEGADTAEQEQQDPRRVLSVAGSIQSAKGETHAATLLLECLDRRGKKHDIHETLKVLAGGDIQHAKATVQRAAQLIFVGATRPTHLLVLATHREHAAPYAEALTGRGWSIHDVDDPWMGG